MDERAFQSLLRRVLVASLAAPLLLGCGGRAEVIGGPPEPEVDSGTADSSPDALPLPPPPACQGGDPCGACPPGCSSSDTCQPDGTWACGCACEIDAAPPPPFDAGDVCNPNKQQCPYVIPDFCFDAGLLATDSGQLSPDECKAICQPPQGSNNLFCSRATDPNGNHIVDCYAQCVTGRRPGGNCGTRRAKKPRRGQERSASLLGRFFARTSELEAASIDAFRILRVELAHHGAPAALLEDATRAEGDEVRHARMTRKLARRYGARPRAVRVPPRPVRSLEAIAMENAVEGCVRETFGALLAMYQAENAADPKVRAAMAHIAPDEARHGALGWKVAAWVEPLLDPAARARVGAAKRAAIVALEAELRESPPEALARVAGLPSSMAAQAMLRELGRSLFSGEHASQPAA